MVLEFYMALCTEIVHGLQYLKRYMVIVTSNSNGFTPATYNILYRYSKMPYHVTFFFVVFLYTFFLETFPLHCIDWWSEADVN